ncbi:MAG TPA: hypothetical protein PLJ99_00180 [Kiritimatiellia bacterium]|nr:hypothetical protein [Kiritimatiellia bacterium]HPJ57414.1 hypothetical protein [Kiritimatiellia bacterium]HPR67686.1 hypothetical protein [Kiritimatiellia bacterium]HRX06789.1 hypothetical protein [Kiritimatiellia bacterium]
MPWVLGLIVLLGGLLLAVQAVRAQGGEGEPGITVERVTRASNAEIERMLGRIEARPAPEQKMGAMCYDMCMPPPVTEYVCPVCGEKTLYPVPENQWSTPLNRLEGLRRLQAEAQVEAGKRGASVELDEQAFCRKCRPMAVDEPASVLVVRLPDGRETRTVVFTEDDLRVLRDFFAGRDVKVGSQDDETPLKRSLPRLRSLLGMAE